MHFPLVGRVHKSPFRSAIPVALGTLLLAAAPASAAPVYSITDLGTLGNQLGYAYGINDAGHVVGRSWTGAGFPHAFLHDGTTIRDLNTLPGGTFPGGTAWNAVDINNAGHVVGQAGLSGGGGITRPFLYDGTTMHDLGTLPGGTAASATAINNAGLVAGWSSSHSGTRAFLHDGTTMHDLGTLGGSSSSAAGINDAGHVVGNSRTVDDVERAFFYDGTTMHDLGTLPGSTTSYAVAINNAGQVVGYARFAIDKAHAFLYDLADGTMHDLGTLPGRDESFATGINDAGRIVGYSRVADGSFHAFVYDGGTMYDLNDLIDPDDLLHGSVVLEQAWDINERGDIAAYGCYTAGQLNGYCRPFLLTALDTEPVSAIPEPGSLALLGSALLGISLLQRRREARH